MLCQFYRQCVLFMNILYKWVYSLYYALLFLFSPVLFHNQHKKNIAECQFKLFVLFRCPDLLEMCIWRNQSWTGIQFSSSWETLFIWDDLYWLLNPLSLRESWSLKTYSWYLLQMDSGSIWAMKQQLISFSRIHDPWVPTNVCILLCSDRWMNSQMMGALQLSH